MAYEEAWALASARTADVPGKVKKVENGLNQLFCP